MGTCLQRVATAPIEEEQSYKEEVSQIQIFTLIQNYKELVLDSVSKVPTIGIEYYKKECESEMEFLREVYVLKTIKDDLTYFQEFYINYETHQIYLPAYETNIHDKMSDMNAFIVDISTWLAKIHRLGLVWQDPKLDNILYDTTNKQFLVCDFGVSSPINYDLGMKGCGTPGQTLAVGKSSPYHDFLKFSQILIYYSNRHNWQDAQECIDQGYINLYEKKLIGDEESYHQLFTNFYQILQKTEQAQ